MSEYKFICLGTSSGLPQANRATSGYALVHNNSISIIDCGGGVTSSFLRQGLNPQDVENIFITHTHSDHVCEISLMVQAIYLSGRTDRLTIIVPEEFLSPLSNYLPALYLFKERLTFDLKIRGYKEGDIFDDNFKLSAISNNHLIGYKEFLSENNYQNKMECFSFSIKTKNSSLFYSSDIGSLSDIRNHLDGHDIALVEATHIDLDELFQLIPTVDVGQFVVTHLGEITQIEDICRRADKHGIENLICAVDGLVLSF